MSTPKNKSGPREAKGPRPAGIIAFGIGLCALIAFLVLARTMAPPFPKPAATNGPPAAVTNATQAAS